MSFETEKFKHRGRLAEKENQARSLKLSIDGLVHAIRDLLDPFEKTEELKVDMAAELTLELAAKHIDYRGLLSEIRGLKKALGIS